MRYYMIEREADEEDDPCRIYLELNDSGVIQRKAEVYLNGIYILSKEPESSPADLAALTSDGQRLILTAQQFDEIWYQAPEMPSGIMGLFF